MIYLFDNEKRYVGAKELKSGEEMPLFATTVQPIIGDYEQAHFIDGKWIVSKIEIPIIIEQPQQPTLEERVSEIEQVTVEVINALNDKGILPGAR